MPPAAKRRRLDQPEEITFDPSARQEYLIGFHKRKQQRILNARETAAKRDKEEKVRERKQLREQRKEDLERHVTEVNAELKKQTRNLANVSDTDSSVEGVGTETWAGIKDPVVAEVLPDDEEYVDEDKYTTVTVEPMDGGDEGDDDGNGADEERQREVVKPANGRVIVKKRTLGNDGHAKAKRKKFRYETKAERSATRAKQKSKNAKAKLKRTGK